VRQQNERAVQVSGFHVGTTTGGHIPAATAFTEKLSKACRIDTERLTGPLGDQTSEQLVHRYAAHLKTLP
jgi:hypothetical protein